MLTIERRALEQLSALLLERAGLKIAPDGYHGLKLALSARMPALGISNAEEYVRRLRELAGEHELRSLLPLVTVGHTEFFRDARQFRALEADILPRLLKTVRREARKMGIWSAGCATGEEPYSLAMVLDELGALPEDVNLWATDLNLAAVDNAKLGRFPLRRVKDLHPERLKRYFTAADDFYEVAPKLKRFIRFEGHNLAAPVFTKVPDGSLDLILCRNVIIYFDLPTIRALMDRFLMALRPGGRLLLGYSESLFQVYDRFEMVEIEGAFVYRKPEQPVAARPSLRLPLTPVPASPLPLGGGPTPPPIGRPKTGEIAMPPPAVARRPTAELPVVRRLQTPVPVPAAQVALRTPAVRLAEVVHAMERGQFEQAMSTCRKLTEDEPGDLDALLTLGNLLSITGQSQPAMDVFSQVMTREPLCVEARLFAAIAALQTGSLEVAKAELSKALFLEPTLAIGHYLQAQVHERLGDRETARRAYRNALSQLRHAQRPLAGHYPELPDAPESIQRAARYALAALEDAG